MEKIPVENKSEMAIYVGATMIPPGEIRHFYEHELPPEFKPVQDAAPEQLEEVNPLVGLLDLSIAKIELQFAELSTEQLEKLGELEQLRENPRQTLLSKIAAELLTRASRLELKHRIESLPTLSKEDFDALVEAEKAKGAQADAELAEAIANEVKRREESGI